MGILHDLFGHKTPPKEQQDHSTTNNGNVYSSLTHYQKLAAMNLMFVLGGSCSGSPQEVSKINHIMTQEGHLLGISGAEMHAANSSFSGMKEMSDALKGADRKALERLFLPFYCIIAVGKDPQAVQLLLIIYKDYGFSEQDCISILEKYSGKRLSEL